MKVIIMGAGGIGRRHAESIVRTGEVDGLWIVDPSGKALRETSKLLAGLDKPASMQISLDKRIDSSGIYDVGIVATSANQRFRAIQDVRYKTKHLILEKFLFNQEKEYDIDFAGNKVYVNCPRRTMDCYDRFMGPKPSIFYYGFGGLLSNSIHFADLLCHLTGVNKVKWDIEIHKSIRTKRWGYRDAKGRIIIRVGAGMVYLHTTPMNRDHKGPMLVIDDCHIDEDKREATMLGFGTVPFEFKYQSDLTGGYIKDIAQTGTCRLAKYEQSAEWHLGLLKQLRVNKWNHNIT